MSRKQKKTPASADSVTVAGPPEFQRSPEFRSYYVNNTGIQGTPWDISLLLGRIVNTKGNRLLVEQFAQVYMSPAHAKAVSELLTRQLQAYERKHGPITTTGYKVKGEMDKSSPPDPSPNGS